MNGLNEDAFALINGRHADPFHYLGRHSEDGQDVIRAFIPHAISVSILQDGDVETPMARIHDAGLFVGRPATAKPYRLRVSTLQGTSDIDDPYRFLPILSDYDLYLLGEGTLRQLYDLLGAHPMTREGVEGIGFVLYAPSAVAVAVVGDFNGWDTRCHPMRRRGQGYWELFLPAAKLGQRYKFSIIGPNHQQVPLKADPLAFYAEVRPDTASIIFDEKAVPLPRPLHSDANARHQPISIYEVHLGSWRRKDGNTWLTYLELAQSLPQYVRDLGFTHVEFMPVNEHPFDGSWGYQPTGLFAPTSRFGTPFEFAALIDACHEHGLAVLLDWVPGHFPDDPHGLGAFDGTSVYEHANPMQGRHLDWGTLIYNYGRTEVTNFLVSNALFWMDRYNVDGLRVDAVASMLYLDYSRPHDQWVPNQYGGRENLEAVSFLRRFNTEVFGKFPGATTIAEESTSWPQVSQPVDNGGLGFGYKWNMGWMHDTLNYISEDPINRKHHHDKITFGLHYAFSENFILPLSHDEVVHGKGSIIQRMPGDEWQRFANLRAYYAFMFGHPGKKLLFMGCEFGQLKEWNHDQSLDWHLLEQPNHRGVQALIRDLNTLYRNTPALHQRDCEAAGFEWLIDNDVDNNIFAWQRIGHDGVPPCLIVVNFAPVVRHDYRVPAPRGGNWREVLNTDASVYGGSNVGNLGVVSVDPTDHRLHLTLPPLAAIFLIPEA